MYVESINQANHARIRWNNQGRRSFIVTRSVDIREGSKSVGKFNYIVVSV